MFIGKKGWLQGRDLEDSFTRAPKSSTDELYLICTWMWRFQGLGRFENVKTGLNIDAGAQKQFDSRRLQFLRFARLCRRRCQARGSALRARQHARLPHDRSKRFKAKALGVLEWARSDSQARLRLFVAFVAVACANGKEAAVYPVPDSTVSVVLELDRDVEQGRERVRSPKDPGDVAPPPTASWSSVGLSRSREKRRRSGRSTVVRRRERPTRRPCACAPRAPR